MICICIQEKLASYVVLVKTASRCPPPPPPTAGCLLAAPARCCSITSSPCFDVHSFQISCYSDGNWSRNSKYHLIWFVCSTYIQLMFATDAVRVGVNLMMLKILNIHIRAIPKQPVHICRIRKKLWKLIWFNKEKMIKPLENGHCFR